MDGELRSHSPVDERRDQHDHVVSRLAHGGTHTTRKHDTHAGCDVRRRAELTEEPEEHAGEPIVGDDDHDAAGGRPSDDRLGELRIQRYAIDRKPHRPHRRFDLGAVAVGRDHTPSARERGRGIRRQLGEKERASTPRALPTSRRIISICSRLHSAMATGSPCSPPFNAP